jgi:hypothetical protein
LLAKGQLLRARWLLVGSSEVLDERLLEVEPRVDAESWQAAMSLLSLGA